MAGLSGIQHHMFEIDSTCTIITVSAAKLKGIFLGCHNNNVIQLFHCHLRIE